MSKPTLPIGTRVYYTGDVCNDSDRGTIAEVRVDLRWGTDYRIVWDTEGHKDSWISPAYFAPGSGRRFMTLQEYQDDRAAKMAAMEAEWKAQDAAKVLA